MGRYIKTMEIFESEKTNHPKIEILDDSLESVNIMGEFFPSLSNRVILSSYYKTYGDFYLIKNPESKEVYILQVYGDPERPSSMIFSQEGKTINLESIYPQSLKDTDIEKMFEDACERYGTKMYKVIYWAKKNIHSLSNNFYENCLEIIKNSFKADPSSIMNISEYPELQDELLGDLGKKFPNITNLIKRGY